MGNDKELWEIDKETGRCSPSYPPAMSWEEVEKLCEPFKNIWKDRWELKTCRLFCAMPCCDHVETCEHKESKEKLWESTAINLADRLGDEEMDLIEANRKLSHVIFLSRVLVAFCTLLVLILIWS
jgi:hypothetical protein